MPTLPAKLLPQTLKSMTRKRDCRVKLSNYRTVEPFGYWWDGGSRTEYTVYDVNTGRTRRPTLPSGPPAFSGDAKPIELADGEVLVVHGTFCGKDSQLSIQVPECLAPKFAGVAFPKDLDPATPLPIVRDYLRDHDREEDAAKLETFYGPDCR